MDMASAVGAGVELLIIFLIIGIIILIAAALSQDYSLQGVGIVFLALSMMIGILLGAGQGRKGYGKQYKGMPP